MKLKHIIFIFLLLVLILILSLPALFPKTEPQVTASPSLPLPGNYAGTGMFARYADGTAQQISDGGDMALVLYEDGSADLTIAGSPWRTSWTEEGILGEFDVLSRFTVSGNSLSFGWEGGDGYYTYEFEYRPE